MRAYIGRLLGVGVTVLLLSRRVGPYLRPPTRMEHHRPLLYLVSRRPVSQKSPCMSPLMVGAWGLPPSCATS